MVMYDNEFETRDKISEDKIEPHHTYSISCGDTEGAMVMYDNEFETRDKISEDKNWTTPYVFHFIRWHWGGHVSRY